MRIMVNNVRRDGEAGLERSCAPARSDWLSTREASDGVQLLEAWFARHGFDRHRHDTYAIGVTDVGVQMFDYRGATERSTPGHVVVLHPDEPHDGRAGTRDGFGYRILYVAPARIAEAARAICRRPSVLPFVRQPVARNPRLAHAVGAAFRHGREPLAVDGAVLELTGALLEADPSSGPARPIRMDQGAIARARAFLDAETGRVVGSSELEVVSGLTRYELARQFRAGVGTSPYRYSVMRRLDRARADMRANPSLAHVALACGFADQAHFSRMFKAAFGLTPARYRAIAAVRTV